MSKAFIYHKGAGRNKNNRFLVEIEVMGKELYAGRTLLVIRPVSGEGSMRVNEETVIYKK